jgi:DNA-directed RNA polymerase alpha subunit
MSQFLISCKESKIETNRSFYSSFLIGSFHSSESVTLANALRRSLLSELPGIAIISVQIEGVAHEYSNLPGIRDSVLDILLNLREIVLKKLSKIMRPQIGYLRVRGPGVVRAGDLSLPPLIQCVDPEQYIATLAEDGVLNIKFIITEGNNYIKGKQKMAIDFHQFKKHRLILKKLNQICRNSLILRNYYNYFKQKSKQKSQSDELSRSNIFLQVNPINFDLSLKRNKVNATNYRLKKPNPNIESIKKNNLILSILNIDAVFNPILNVNYIIEVNEHKILETLLNKTNKIENQLSILKTEPIFETSLNSNVLKLKKENLKKQLKRSKTLVTNSDLTYLKKLLNYQINLRKFNDLTNKKKIKKLEFPKKTFPINFGNSTKNKNLQMWTSEGKNENIFHNNIILEIWTNGSLHPREAMYEAFKYLIKLFSKLKQIQSIEPLALSEVRNIHLIRQFNHNLNSLFPLNQQTFIGKYTGIQQYPLKKTENFLEKKMKENLSNGKIYILPNLIKKSQYNLKRKPILKSNKESLFSDKVNNTNFSKTNSKNITILKLTLRTFMALKKNNINTIDDLLDLTRKDFLNFSNIGKKSIEEIEQSLLKIGSHLKMN